METHVAEAIRLLADVFRKAGGGTMGEAEKRQIEAFETREYGSSATALIDVSAATRQIQTMNHKNLGSLIHE